MVELRTSIFFALLVCSSYAAYEPSWDSLDTRPSPAWYDESKFGIFIHWGVFSVPSFGNEWFWYSWNDSNQEVVNFINQNYPEKFTYQAFAKDFTAEFYDPNKWADIFARSGAKYVVLTSKHHEGYTLWPSKYSYSWNAMDVGPKQDLLGDLANAVRAKNLTFGVYHSLLEWFHPIYNSDKNSNWQKQEFVDNKILPEMKELVKTYKPSIIWSDGDWESTAQYWKAEEFIAWLYNDSPVKDYVIVNDRWGNDSTCQHGDVFTCSDRYNPGVLQEHKWENALTIDSVSWGFRRNADLSDYLSAHDLLSQLISTVSCGGNLLVNVGPTKDGIITPIYQERLEQVGDWLAINGEAIYSTKPWLIQNDTLSALTWYTARDNNVYAIVLFWPGALINLASSKDLFTHTNTKVYLLGNEELGSLTILLHSEHWFVDGTFSISPPLFCQVYVIMAKRFGGVHPAVYVLLPNKQTQTYIKMLDLLKSLQPNLHPKRISCDYELAAINAFKSAFPDAEILGCFFHLTKNMRKHLGDLNLVSKYKNDADFAVKARMVTSLAFLPIDSLDEAVDELSNVLPPELEPLLQWFEDSYIGRPNRRGKGRRQAVFPPKLWSVHDRVLTNTDRINNHAEAAHRRLQTELSMDHPTIWKFIDSLKAVQRGRDVTYEYLLAGHEPAEKKNYPGGQETKKSG